MDQGWVRSRRFGMDFELYHDESKRGGYWHGMLLVPVPKKARLVELLCTVRQNVGYRYPLSLKKVKRSGPICTCAECWIQLGVLSLMSRQKGLPDGLHLGERLRDRKKFVQFKETIGAKFILFREVHDHANMTDLLDYGGKMETTFRIGLKGGLHFLGNESETLHIRGLHFDGHKHYGRHLDRRRIVARLTGLRHYCSVDDRADVIDDRSSDHSRSDCQDYDDCQLLQLADLLVGAFRTVLHGPTRSIHNALARPVKAIVKRYQKGYARMRPSRWRDSFCMSQCYLEAGTWQFDTIACEPDQQQLQMPLPF